MNSIGYEADGVGHLAPPEPQHRCTECHCDYWEMEDLDDNGVCDDCQSDFCSDCGRHMDGSSFCEECHFMSMID